MYALIHAGASDASGGVFVYVGGGLAAIVFIVVLVVVIAVPVAVACVKKRKKEVDGMKMLYSDTFYLLLVVTISTYTELALVYHTLQ